MIDHFAILLTHGLMMLACWRLLFRPDLDQEAPPAPKSHKGWGEADAG